MALKRSELKRKTPLRNNGWPREPKPEKANPRIVKWNSTNRKGAALRRWNRLKGKVFTRDGGRCVVCGHALSKGFWEAHHRRYRSRGGLDELCNLIAVCIHPCHRQSIHLDVTGVAEANGWAVSQFGAGPETIPVLYADGRSVLLCNESEAA